MNTFIDSVFSPENIIATTLLCIIIVYWLIVLIGAIDMDFLDFDLDIDTPDIDVDMPDVEIGSPDVEVDADIDAQPSVSSEGVPVMHSILSFFNIGKMPFMVYLTFLILPLWLITVNINHYLGNHSFLLSLGIFVPTLIVSLFIAKYLTWPFVKIFQKLDESNKPVEIVGKICKLVLPASKEQIGQAEINIKGSSILIYVKTYKNPLEKGKTALVIQQHQSKDYYIVEPYENL